MNFEGCLPRWKPDAEKYLHASYRNDWAPEVVQARIEEDEIQAPTRNPSKIKLAAAGKASKKPKQAASGFSAFSAMVNLDFGGHEPQELQVEEEEVEVPSLSEVDKYLQLPALPTTRNGVDTCPLEWWRLHEFELPHLAKMARQFLAMPASSAGVERLFTAAGTMHDDFRKSTKEDTLSMQLEVKVNVT